MGRPPAGAHPGEKVKDYPQVSLRIPPTLKSQLYALSVLRSKPQWRVLIDAIECLIRDLPESEKRIVHDIETGNARGPRRGLQVAGEDAQDRRLARPVRPEEAHDLTGADGQGDVVNREAGAVPLGELFGSDDGGHQVIGLMTPAGAGIRPGGSRTSNPRGVTRYSNICGAWVFAALDAGPSRSCAVMKFAFSRPCSTRMNSYAFRMPVG